MNMLDTYLETLAEGELQKTASQETFKDASIEELTKAAGIKIAADCCGKCGSRMEKSGSIYKCSCGMMKKAEEEKEVFLPSFGPPGMRKVMKRKSRVPPAAMTKEALIGPLSEVSGLGLPSAIGYALGRSHGAAAAKAGAERPEGIRGIDIAGAAFLPGYTGYQLGIRGAHDRAAKEKEKKEKEKDAGIQLLTRLAPNLMRAGGPAVKGLKATAKGRGTLGMGKGLTQAQRTAQKGVGTKSLRQAGEQFGASAPGQLLQRAGQTQVGGKTVGQHLRAGGDWVKANPYKSLAGGTLLGVGAGKTVLNSADPELLKVGDSAGKLLAKVAQGIPVEELKESIEEAQAREDILGRAKKWQIGGGVAGGLAGGAAAGLPTFLATRSPLLAGGAALLGAGGGAAAGQHFGKRHGAEEAAADKAISLLRALRAHRAGQSSGYGAGLQRGYAYGRGYGGETGATE